MNYNSSTGKFSKGRKDYEKTNTNSRTDFDRYCKSILENNVQYYPNHVEIIKKLVKPMYKVIPTTLKMGFKLQDMNENNVNQKILHTEAVYEQKVFVYPNCYVPIYTGQTEEENHGVAYRTARFVKAALGENRSDEKHSGGQYLYDVFQNCRVKYWHKNLYLSFISLEDIKYYLKDIVYNAYPNSLPMTDTTYIKIEELSNAAILDYFEKLAFDIRQPAGNKNNTNPGKYGDDFYINQSKLRDMAKICMS
tara:strand:- start:35 stop:784 length:750 start_codon:yes stop_codon:yes gene_type:complete